MVANFNANPLVKIGVLGVGGAGCNAVNMMVEEGKKIAEDEGYSIFNEIAVLAANTDSQDLENTLAPGKIQLGANHTLGWGAGAKPDVGKQSAEESKVDIATAIEGLDMLFITAGMGGGTGTGAAPVIASIAKQSDILTVGIVTKPFLFEGKRKLKLSEEGIDRLRESVDTLVVIPNEKLVEMAEATDGAREMFQRSNIVLLDAVRNIAELISNKSYINVDFADIKTIMTDMGVAMIGFGTATGENAAINAVKEALNNPLLSDISIEGANRMLLHFGGMNIPLRELNEAARFVSGQVHEDADFIWGATADDTSDKVFALIVAEAVRERSTSIKPSNTVSRDQSNLFEMNKKDEAIEIKASENNKVKEIIEKNLVEDAEISVEVTEELRPAATNKSKDVFSQEKKTMTMEDEDIIFEIPTDMVIDENDRNIPAYLRTSVIRKNSDDKSAKKTESRSNKDFEEREQLRKKEQKSYYAGGTNVQSEKKDSE